MTTPSTAGRPDSDDGSERYFEAIGPRQCFDLIEAHHLGRIAWQAADRPQILPVTYALHEGSVYFRTLPEGILAELAQPTSVVLHGRTSTVREPEELADLWASDALVPWASGNRTLFIRIRPERVAGRVVRRQI
jgi:uncharacterized protein